MPLEVGARLGQVDAPHADAADAELVPHEVVERDPDDDEVAAGLHLLELDLVLGARAGDRFALDQRHRPLGVLEPPARVLAGLDRVAVTLEATAGEGTDAVARGCIGSPSAGATKMATTRPTNVGRSWSMGSG